MKLTKKELLEIMNLHAGQKVVLTLYNQDVLQGHIVGFYEQDIENPDTLLFGIDFEVELSVKAIICNSLLSAQEGVFIQMKTIQSLKFFHEDSIYIM